MQLQGSSDAQLASVRLHPSEACVLIKAEDLGEIDDPPVSREAREAARQLPPPSPELSAGDNGDGVANGHSRAHKKDKKRHKKACMLRHVCML